jgi:hypothetical protein
VSWTSHRRAGKRETVSRRVARVYDIPCLFTTIGVKAWHGSAKDAVIEYVEEHSGSLGKILLISDNESYLGEARSEILTYSRLKAQASMEER